MSISNNDTDLAEKLRAMGARLVETCQSCKHSMTEPGLGLGWSGVTRCRLHNLQLPTEIVCNNYAHAAGNSPLGHVRKHLDRVATPRRDWVTCQYCSWEGWSLECLDDGYEVWDRCPQCKERVHTESP